MMNSTELGHRIIRLYPFASKALLNERGISIYVPPGYYMDKNKRYPVLYMHDGQSIFESNPFSTSSWNVHRTVDELIAKGLMKEIIIVGIDNYGQERLNEFAHPLQSSGIPGAPDIICKGESYERFLIEELKPNIDNMFRTLPAREHTALMGSSMGGLVTYNIGFRNPHIFSKLAVMSPYFIRLDLNTLQEIPFYKRYRGVNNLALWLDIGEVEANILVKHVRGVVEELIEQGFVFGKNLMFYEVPSAAHTEEDWAARVRSPLLFFFGKPVKAVKAELYGREEVGLTGMTVRLNPVITLDSGLTFTDWSGRFDVSDPEVLQVQSNGVVVPGKTGRAHVTYRGFETSAGRDIEVVPSLPDIVRVTFRIQAPTDTPTKDMLYVGRLAIPRLSENLFGGTFQLPRDTAMRYKITTDNGLRETKQDGWTLPYRILRLNEDMEVELAVEAWESRSNFP